ncbi:nonribosomal peptide synthase SidD [Blastomyces gilchristii SLH14081]|uniref:Nonribosomal peptide synthase SidD n=1 Tax=Blastomyces gilchristii (strain SLH14081) TaxID=559298 RepID=A0A179UJM9_BLAGS|nr:nonribosomal peptide synthase SidD [Blastomyces gilchristii SLH14081]OAT06652.1 nonribosomal peptide synthase SidD [Blastomyces gilchristii SLH14081]
MSEHRQQERRCIFPKLDASGLEGRQFELVYLDHGCLEYVTKQAAIENTAPLFDLVQFGWSILLHKYTDSDTVTFGVGEDLKGNVIDQVVAVVDASSPISNSVRLQKLREWPTVECSRHEHFNTCLLWEDVDTLGWISNDGDRLPMIEDISVIVNSSALAPQVSMRYSTSILSHPAARNVIATLGAILGCLSCSPSRALSESPLLGDYHKQQISAWNTRAPTYPLDCCIHALFHLQCMLHPDSQAVCAWDGDMTYQDLDALSWRVQARLSALDVGSGSIVPLLFEKSKWAVVAMLGVLKAGAAFVALDSTYPKKRLRDICEDVEADVIICADWLVQHNLSCTTIAVGDCTRSWGLDPSPNQPRVQSHDPAYVVYTSGSTGTPKGIVIEHASFCSNAIASSKAQNLNSSSRVLQFASYAFDISIHECLTTLILGGCVCIPSEFQRLNDLKNAVRDLHVNWAELTPTVAKLLMPEDVPRVKTLILGGESMTSLDIALWHEKVRLICAYGPAECTVVANVQPHVTEPGNIGFSFGGSCWIVDKDNHNCLAAIGTIGELVIGGPIVSRGYLKRPEQTAAAFISSPEWASEFGMGSDHRFYKTGDLARYSSDGSIVYIGRKDTQVKVYGQRVELGEIEHISQQCLKEAMVVAEIITHETRRSSLVLFVAKQPVFTAELVASVTICAPDREFREDVARLKVHLQKALPTYMVPAAYIPLAAMPVTRTGKVNRRALQNAVGNLPETQLRDYRMATSGDRGLSPAETPIEELVQQLLATVLGLPLTTVGMDDNFLRLGGDSVSAVRFVETARQQGLKITVESLFADQSISNLARNIAADQANHDQQQPPPFSLLNSMGKGTMISSAASKCCIRPESIQDIYPCTPLQESFIAYTARSPGSLQCSFHFQMTRHVDVARFKRAWAEVCDGHPILRTRIILADSLQAFQVVSSEGGPQCQLIENELEFPEQFMSLGAPLVSTSLAGEGNEEVPLTFTLTIHHALFDGWSYQRILDATENAYNGIHLPSQPFTLFIEYVNRLNPGLARHFWSAEFQGLRTIGFPCPLVPVGYSPMSIRTVTRHIVISEWPRGSYTSSTVIRLAFATLLSWYMETNDVVFGVTVAGRGAPVPGIYQMTGPTIATFPLRTILHPALSIEETLREMQEHATKLIQFEQTGLRRIRSYGQEASAACDFQTLLVIQPRKTTVSSNLFTESPDNSAEQLKFSTHPLTMVCELSGERSLSITAVFDSCVLKHDETQIMLERFDHVLHSITDNPAQRIGSLIPNTGQRMNESGLLRDAESQAQNYLGKQYQVVVEMVCPKDLCEERLTVFVCENSGHQNTEAALFAVPEEKFKLKLCELMDYMNRALSWSMLPILCLPINYVPRTAAAQPDKDLLRFAVSQKNLSSLQPIISCPNESQGPVSEHEEKIRNIIARVIGVETDEVGIDDDFFRLGGDSISAIQLVTLCREDGLSLTALDVFDAKTVKLIASKAKPSMELTPPSTPSERKQQMARFALLSLSPAEEDKFEFRLKANLGIAYDEIEDAYPCTRVHEGLLVTQSLNAFEYQSYTIWEVTSKVPQCAVWPVRLGNAWEDVVRRHPALRTILFSRGTNGQEKIHVVRKTSNIKVQILSCTDNEVTDLLRKSSLSNRDIGALPYQFTICKTESGRIFCKLEGNDAFLDATSLLIILRELSKAYRGQLSSSPAPLYRSAVAYFYDIADFKSQMDYWITQMVDIQPCMFPQIQSNGCQKGLRTMSREVADKALLNRFCLDKGVTKSNIFQIAWGMVLRKYTQLDDVCFGMVISGRDVPIPEIHNIIGSFFNVLVCRLRFTIEDRCSDVLARNQAENRNRLRNGCCSLIDVLQQSRHFGKPLFNTCMSVEQPLSTENGEGEIRFKEVETYEATEYDIIINICVGKETVEATFTYWASVLEDSKLVLVADEFGESISQILSRGKSTDTLLL